MKLKKGLCLVLSMSILMTFTIRSHAQDKEFININITTEEELFNDNDIKLSRSSSSPSVKDDNLDELTRKRDFLIRENYTVYRNKIKSGAIGYNKYFKEMLDS